MISKYLRQKRGSIRPNNKLNCLFRWREIEGIENNCHWFYYE